MQRDRQLLRLQNPHDAEFSRAGLADGMRRRHDGTMVGRATLATLRDRHNPNRSASWIGPAPRKERRRKQPLEEETWLENLRGILLRWSRLQALASRDRLSPRRRRSRSACSTTCR